MARMALFTADRWLIKDFFCTDMTSSVKVKFDVSTAGLNVMLRPVRFLYKQELCQIKRRASQAEGSIN